MVYTNHCHRKLLFDETNSLEGRMLTKSPLFSNSVPMADVRLPFRNATKLLLPSYKLPDPDDRVEDHFSIKRMASNTCEPRGRERTVPSQGGNDDDGELSYADPPSLWGG